MAEVQQAVVELDRQKDQVRLAGRTFVVDLVMRAPRRFTGEVRAALEAELPLLTPAVVRSRFRLREEGPVAEVGLSSIQVVTPYNVPSALTRATSP